MKPRTGRMLVRFHRRVDRRFMGRQPRWGRDCIWLYPPSGGRDGRGGTEGGGDIRLPPPEHSHTFYCDQTHNETLYGGIKEAGFKGEKSLVVSGRNGYGGDAYGGLVGRTDGGGTGDIQDRNRDRVSQWEENVPNVTLGTEPNAPN